MSAAIVHSVARSIILDAEMLEDAATMPQSAENSRRDIPGQLWERVAEATPNLAILSHATTAAIWEVGCRPKWRDERGPVSRPIHHSGIIRAGERIK